jgi:4-amino-4-deoxychorismate lyase
MSRAIESIYVGDGQPRWLAYHQHRVEQTFKTHWPGAQPIVLADLLSNGTMPQSGIYKCRVVYSSHCAEVHFVPYRYTPVCSLKLLQADDATYATKWEDRTLLEQLLTQRGVCDDILIIKNRQITDSSYANIVFRKGEEWFTPASYLLPGVMRQVLLDQQKIREEEIHIGNFRQFQSFKLINVMIGFDAEEVDVANIV